MSQQVKVYRSLDFFKNAGADKTCSITPAADGGGIDITVTSQSVVTEAHGVGITYTGTVGSGENVVGLNVVLTAAGSAGSWGSGAYFKFAQAAKYINGYFCAAEFETVSVAAGASDHAVVVLNATNNHTGSKPVSPYILLRDYGTTHADALFRIYGDTGQGDTSTFSASALITSAQDTYEAGCNAAVRCMSGSTQFWLLASTTAPTA